MTGPFALAIGTLISEDLTCVTAGLLIQAGRLAPLPAVLGCLAGIYLGDVGLWLAGRLFGRALLEGGHAPGWLARRLPAESLRAARERFDRHAPAALLAARFLPGTRLPIYVAAGAFGQRSGRFLLWTLIAALLWTPIAVLFVALTGRSILQPLDRLPLPAAVTLPLAAALLLGLLAAARVAVSPRRRSALAARLQRLRRFEFWPAPVAYAPLAAHIALLAIRHRGLATITAANPGIPDGGFVGESKYGILRRLPRERVVPGLLLPPGPATARLDRLQRAMRERGWTYPLILKPDVGERGNGVRLVRDRDAARDYLWRHGRAVLAQVYHPGPFEAGIFYYRIPGEGRGRIFSITDKRFPEVVGDGRSTLEELIWRHPRYRLQAATFLKRHAARRAQTPAAGERVRLAHAGNHIQGTMFLDGARLFSPALQRAIDDVARRFAGFYFGRFDVRYADEEELRAGRDFTILELNGITSESTNIYDPAMPVTEAYRILFRQWSLLFRIGDLNRRRGARPTPLADLLRSTAAHLRRPAVFPISD